MFRVKKRSIPEEHFFLTVTHIFICFCVLKNLEWKTNQFQATCQMEEKTTVSVAAMFRFFGGFTTPKSVDHTKIMVEILVRPPYIIFEKNKNWFRQFWSDTGENSSEISENRLSVKFTNTSFCGMDLQISGLFELSTTNNRTYKKIMRYYCDVSP